MKHLPNLLKQESSSAATLVHVLLRMYFDERSGHQSTRPQIAERLLPYVMSPSEVDWDADSVIQIGLKRLIGLRQTTSRHTSQEHCRLDACCN
jgi:hypothetical protein